MPDLSPRLSLPYLMPAQAQKHVTHNEALRALDGLVQLAVLESGAETPPADPALGATYALGGAPGGAWADQPHALAIWQGEGWLFLSPQPGWRLWDMTGQQMRVWDGAAWGPLPCHRTPQLGVNAEGDANNPLTVSGPATLLTHAGAVHQLKVNKSATSDTASLLYQTGFSGRAEIGLAGADDLTVKLSSDGSTWHDAMVLSAAPTAPRLTLSQPGITPDLLHAEAGGVTAFRLTGSGDGLCSGSWQSGGADYAEFFEWSDGNPNREDRRGLSVVLVGDKIRAAQPGETPIGIISAAPALLGDADGGEWRGKYQRDPYGALILDPQNRPQIAADFDPNRAYTPRQHRPEWAMVGLLGKLVLRQGQPTAPRWQRLNSTKDGLERWLVR